MKKLIIFLMVILSAYVFIMFSSCKKTESPCLAPPTPSPRSNSPVELYDTIYLSVDTTGIGSYTFYWTGPKGFMAAGPKARILHADSTNAGVYSLMLVNTKTSCYGIPGTVTVSLKIPGPCPGLASISYGGIAYNTVQIGSQCWLKENLSIGKFVASLTSSTNHPDVFNNGAIEKYCYGNDSTSCINSGGLYDWSEMMQYTTTQGAQGICPAGWHVPSLTDWKTLINGIKDANSLSAIKLKPNGSLGFDALLSGFRYPTGSFYSLGDYGDFWSSTASGKLAWNLKITSALPYTEYSESDQYYGYSVRCLKN